MSEDILSESPEKTVEPSGPPPSNIFTESPDFTGMEPVSPHEPGDESEPAEEPEKRGRGRPPGSKNRKVEMPVDYDALAGVTFDLSTGICVNALGPEWAARSPEERATVVKPLARYMETKGVKDLPPGVILCVAVLGYASPRISHPNTRGKIQRFFGWIKGRFSRRPKVAILKP